MSIPDLTSRGPSTSIWVEHFGEPPRVSLPLQQFTGFTEKTGTFCVVMHIENIITFVPFLYYITSDPGYPDWPSRLSREMCKTSENRLLPGNAFADAQKHEKVMLFSKQISLLAHFWQAANPLT